MLIHSDGVTQKNEHVPGAKIIAFDWLLESVTITRRAFILHGSFQIKNQYVGTF